VFPTDILKLAFNATPMSKRAIFFSFLAAISLTACSLSSYSAVEYNNLVAEDINVSSSAIEATATAYNDLIPNRVDETAVIPVKDLEAVYEDATASLPEVKDLLELTSKDANQQAALQSAITTYLAAAEAYLETYGKILAYYESETYKEDLSQVAVLDELLHTDYTTFIEANNDLSTAMETYVSKP